MMTIGNWYGFNQLQTSVTLVATAFPMLKVFFFLVNNKKILTNFISIYNGNGGQISRKKSNGYEQYVESLARG